MPDMNRKSPTCIISQRIDHIILMRGLICFLSLICASSIILHLLTHFCVYVHSLDVTVSQKLASFEACKTNVLNKNKNAFIMWLKDWCKLQAMPQVILTLLVFDSSTKKYLHKKPLKLRFHGNQHNRRPTQKKSDLKEEKKTPRYDKCAILNTFRFCHSQNDSFNSHAAFFLSIKEIFFMNRTVAL